MLPSPAQIVAAYRSYRDSRQTINQAALSTTDFVEAGADEPFDPELRRELELWFAEGVSLARAERALGWIASFMPGTPGFYFVDSQYRLTTINDQRLFFQI